MEMSLSWIRNLLLLVLLVTACNFVDCYDPLDPTGNITIKFDIHKWTSDGYQATVSVQNYYQYRHVEKPGWKLGWAWTSKEVIWSMAGALALRQGNCSSIYQDQIPHSCEREPVIVDHMPDAPPENRSDNCCRGGVISAWGIDNPNSFSSFEMIVGNLGGNSNAQMPENITFLGPGTGYTCGPMVDSPPTVFPANDPRREVQVFKTWKSTCTYSNFVANKAPICCVSLSTFYNRDVTPCPTCSCGCRPANNSTIACVGDGDSTSSMVDNMVRCTDHMCPVRVHWHIRNNYREYWKVKLTVSNYHYSTNYTNWNVVVQHPGFGQNISTYSFNSTTLHTIADTGERLVDEVALFWGLPYYNNDLLQVREDQPGSVTTDIILRKDLKTFTLDNGWAFPRRVYFNGENCEMQMPEKFPGLPNSGSNHGYGILPLILLYLSLQILWL